MTAKLAVLVSGSGTNLQAIIDQVERKEIPASIDVVISNKPKAYALERASAAGIETRCFRTTAYASREDFDQAMVDFLRPRSIDLIILAGFMRILTPVFVRSFPGKIINIHPALLPKYPGTHSIERAFENGDSEVGVTVHFVDEGVDSGPIILQEQIPVAQNDTLETLTMRVHQVEHRLLPEAIRKYLQGRIQMGKG